MLRFAPSPTGDMDISTLRVALLNYIVANQKGVNFIVRIEDNDKAQNITGKDTEIMEILEKFALPHDSVSHQSEHLHMHQTLAIRLLEEKKAFVCTCTPQQLEQEKQKAEENQTAYRYSGRCSDMGAEELQKLKEGKTPFVIRIKAPDNTITHYDLHTGDNDTLPGEVDSFVILRTDGTPTENFASACEDMLSGITLIIREASHTPDTPKQEYIKSLLGYTQKTTYLHLPEIETNAGGITLKWLFEEGFIPDAIVNYLLAVGNNTPSEVFTLPEAIEWFDLSELPKPRIDFDIETLRLLNRKHLERLDDRTLSTLFGFADDAIGKLAKVYLQEASTIKELKAKIEPIFQPKDFNGELGAEMKRLAVVIADAPMFKSFDVLKSHIIKESGVAEQSVEQPLRYLLTGAHQGPDLSDIYPHIKSYLLEVAS